MRNVSEKEIETFFIILHKIVNGDGSWQDCRDEILKSAGEEDTNNLCKFALWDWE